MTAFYIPSINLMGAGCLVDALVSIKAHGFKKGLIVAGKVLTKMGVVASVAQRLEAKGVEVVIFSGSQPNPTIGNVESGLAVLRDNQCD